MEATFFQLLIDGLISFFKSVDWKFVGLFVIFTWLINEGADSSVSFRWLNWLKVIPKGWRVFVTGILLALSYGYIYDIMGKVNYANLFYSILTGMVAWKLGVSYLFEKLKQLFRKIVPEENIPE